MKTNFIFLFIFVLLLSFSNTIFSQEKTKKIIDGKEVTFIDGLPIMGEKEMQFFESLPELKLPENYRGRNFPVNVDNSELPYFREIFNQSSLECGQASGVGYTYTYEIDRLRDVTANTNETTYPTYWVYNWSNNGSGSACPFFDSWNIIKHAGTPNVEDWGGTLNYGGSSRWMSGYDEYYRALQNRLYDFKVIRLNTVDDLDVLRNWINDHLDGSETGGVGNIYCNVPNASSGLPAGTPEAGKKVVTAFGGYANHALCVVGYHDSIRWDYNNDGQYTNHIDINNDGVVDFRDWEIGGVKLANSYYATSWGDAGFAYATYNALCRTMTQGGIWNASVSVISAKDSPGPQLTYKVTLTHSSRNKIKVMAGVSTTPGATEPEFVMDFPIINYQGGSKYMQGGTGTSDKTLEFGLDVSSLLGHVESGATATYYFMVDENDGDNTGTGHIDSWSVMDYTDGLVEIPCGQSNVPLVENGLTTVSVAATINFDEPEVLNLELPAAVINEPYQEQMLGNGGTEPYRWKVRQDFDPIYATAPFPNINQEQLTLTNVQEGYATKEIDFNFPFYGKEYNTFYPHADGYLMFEAGEYPWTFITDEFNIFQNLMSISPYMSKVLNVSGAGGIWYEGDASKATFRWKALEYSTNNVLNFAVSLYPDGTIEFYYGDVNFSAWNKWHGGISQGDAFNYNLLDISNTFNIQPNTFVEFEPLFNQTEMAITNDGLFHGTPTIPYEAVDVDFYVEDVTGLWSVKSLPFFTDGINNLVIRDVTVISGDDNIIEYGESVSVSVEIQNISDEVVEATEMTISTEDSYVTLTDDTEEMETFDPGETIILENAFAFDVSLDVPNNHNIIFSTAIEATAETYESHIYLKAYAPELQFTGIAFDDGNNGYLEPGETAQVFVDLKNMGGGTAYNIDMLFENTDPYITINQASYTTDELSGGATAIAQFEIFIDESTPTSHTTTFDVSAEADFGFTASDSFTASIGIILEDFETGNFDMYDWQFGGEAEWSIDQSNPYEGLYCMKSGPIDDNESSTASLTIDVIADGQIAFYYKVSSEGNYDYLRFYIDGSVQGSWDGEQGWADASFAVDAGEHTFKWAFEKDYSQIGGEDCGRIDFIMFPPMAAPAMSVNAGPDMDVCESDSPVMNATATNYENVFWTTSGDGMFSDNTIMNPFYTPGVMDVSNGYADLTVTVSDGSNTMEDGMTVNIQAMPVVNAGEDVSYCEDITSIELSGEMANTEQYEWTTSGDGTFEDALALETLYYPGIFDIANMAVTLTLTGDAVEPCAGSAYQDMEITFLPLPDVNFAAIENFCQNSPAYELTEGSPEGGEYSGPNVIDGWFYPEDAGVGTHTLTYIYSDANGCENFANLEVVVDDCTGVGEFGKESISITPNPGKGIFELLINGIDTRNSVVEIYNVTGALVYKKDLSHENAESLTINISEQPDGVYYLYLNNGKITFDEKVIIVR